MKHIPEHCQPDANLALQILLDRILKKIIHNRAEAVQSKKKQVIKPGNITPKESNTMHCMAGFVAVKLLKKFKKPSKNPLVEHKRHLFVRVLTSQCERRVDQETRIQLQNL